MILKSHTNTKTFEHCYFEDSEMTDYSNLIFFCQTGIHLGEVEYSFDRIVKESQRLSDALNEAALVSLQLAASAMAAVNLNQEEDLTDLIRFCQTGRYE